MQHQYNYQPQHSSSSAAMYGTSHPQQPAQYYQGSGNGNGNGNANGNNHSMNGNNHSNMNGNYGNQPPLPRNPSNSSSLTAVPSGPASPSLSPLNPSAGRPSQQYSPGAAGNLQSTANGGRYSTYGYGNGGPGAQGGAHPLSHALYADNRDSSPTLTGHDDEMDEKKGLASFPPPSSSSSGDSRTASSQTIPGRRRPPRANTAGIVANSAYKRWSGAFIADSGSDPRHTKPERIAWLDGLRFIAAWIALNGTFFDAALPNTTVRRSTFAFLCFPLTVHMHLSSLVLLCHPASFSCLYFQVRSYSSVLPFFDPLKSNAFFPSSDPSDSASLSCLSSLVAPFLPHSGIFLMVERVRTPK